MAGDLEEAARDMQREHSGDEVQGLRTEMDQGNHEVAKVRERFVNGVFSTEEAKARTM